MPVKKAWYQVETIKNKRFTAGVAQYLVKFQGYPKDYWTPFYDIESSLIEDYEDRVREDNKSARNLRYNKRKLESSNGAPKKTPKQKW